MKLKHFFLSLCLALVFSQSANAKGFVLINTGDELFEVTEFPSQLVSELPVLNTMRAGYKCHHFGIFWADVWTWDCKLVAVASDSRYSDLPDRVASQLSSNPDYSFSKAKRGFWNHYGVLTLLGALAGLLLLRKAF